MILHLPPELHVNILTFLRANDLSSLQRTCRTFNDRNLIHSIIDTFANTVYPPELSHGFDTPAIGGEVHVLNPHNQFWTYEALRNMEMLVVARILSRPEPPKNACCNAYYVSKNWCRATLKWLEVQAEERKQREQRRLEEAEAAAAAALAEQSAGGKGRKGQVYNGSKQSKKKNSKKQERKNKKLSQKLSGVSPPPLDVNHDITCEHGCLKYSGEGRSSRTSRRLLDRQAWKVLKKLYPQGAQLSILDGECLQCAMEVEMEKRNEEMKKQRETKERKMPLTCPLVRGIYSRRTGVPKECLVFQQNPSDDNLENITFTSPVSRRYPVLRNGSICPLVPGVYNVIPKAWCHHWRKYIKNGEGERPPAPDTSVCLCDAHRLPLIPPHLESFLYGETASLMETTLDVLSRTNHDDGSRTPNMASPSPLPPPGYSLTGDHMLGRGDMETLPSNQQQQPLERIIGGGRIPVPHQGDMIQDEISNLRASGVSESEIQLQRFAMLQIEDQRNRQRDAFERRMRAMNESPTVLARDIDMSPEEIRAKINAQLDRENKVVVEIITDEELEALEKWWPGIHSSYSLKFAVVELDQGSTDIVWTTPPCTYCDASGKVGVCDFAVRNRNRNWVNNTPKKRFGK
mmetsp:Transcript_14270/g.26756  ORF Transcript_14270/g.26756 Transcript_14270/m.26756 type:complete len:630 (-) Transcript_14270:362-2251(-)